MTITERAHAATSRPITWTLATACLAVLLPTAASAVPMVEAPSFRDEVSYLTFTIDHHYSALRLTELAAGTAAVGSSSNYAGAPDVFPSSPAKATNPVALTNAVMPNRGQRMEILEGQDLLRSLYGVNYTPSFQSYLLPLTTALEQAPAGDAFNIAYLEIFSGHHATLTPSSEQCAAAAPNAAVRTYCNGIATTQTREISEMRTELAATYGITSISYETIPLPASVTGTAVPEPASAALFAAGALALGLVRSRQGNARGLPDCLPAPTDRPS